MVEQKKELHEWRSNKPSLQDWQAPEIQWQGWLQQQESISATICQGSEESIHCSTQIILWTTQQ